MRDKWIPEDGPAFAEYLAKMHQNREARKTQQKAAGQKRRMNLSAEQREQILQKTDGRCHVCGGEIPDDNWEADHILAHSSGGNDEVANFLPAHNVCNNYRWDYLPPEFQEILRLGVWLRTQIERQTPVGRKAAARFVTYEKQRIGRRKT